MELRESIESINKRLVDEFGKEFNNEPRFRVVFSDTQFEKRWTQYTDEGFELIMPEVRTLPKYTHYIRGRYILERLVPVIGDTDLTTNVSYEPAWVFQSSSGEYLPPWFDGCKLIIESIYAHVSQTSGFAKYKDPQVDPNVRKQQIEDMQEQLFGNETDIGDALTYKSGVGFHMTPDEKTAHEMSKIVRNN